MKKLKLTEKNKLIIKIGLVVLYFGILLFLILRARVSGEIPYFKSVAFTLPIINRPIYFYALAIITGIGIAYFYGSHIAKKIGFDIEALFDGFIMGTIIGILGARIYYAIFSWDNFKDNPIKIITGFIEGDGGLAIHGAVIAAAIFAYFYCKKKKLDILKVGELFFPGFFIGQIFGRWGNFFNQEAHGGPAGLTPYAARKFLENLKFLPKFVIDQMYIDGTYMHPTFLYESLWNLLGLIILIVLRKKTKKYWYGDAILFYLVWYGVGRFFVEALRTDALPLHIFGLDLRIAQVVSVAMVVAGIVLFILRRVYKVKPISYIEIVEENKLKNQGVKAW